MYYLPYISKSLNNIQSLNKTIFTCQPPLSYGEVIASKEFTTKKLRCFLIRRYYNFLL